MKLGCIVVMRMICCEVKLQMRGLGGSVAGFLRLGGQLLRSMNFNATWGNYGGRFENENFLVLYSFLGATRHILLN